MTRFETLEAAADTVIADLQQKDGREAGEAPAHPYLTGIHQPLQEEFTLWDLEVVGELPAALNGRYLRIGPNPINPDPANHHWFSGDGMVHGLSLENGRAIWYRNRWIRANATSAALGVEPAPGPRHSVFDFVNTNIVDVGGKTFALIEAGSNPVELSIDLEQQRYSDFDGTLKDAYAAHPHLDPRTGEMHAITYHFMAPDLVHHTVVDSTGKVIRELPVPVEHGPYIHDCAITGRYVLIFDLPATLSLPDAMAGSSFPFRWNPAHRARIGLLPRHGEAGDVIWCDVQPGFVFHALNAYDDDDGNVVVDVCGYDRMFDGTPQGFNEPPRGLERWTIDPVTRCVDIETIDPSPQEFPRPDERFFGSKHRFGFTMALPYQTGEQPQGGSGLYKHDLVARTRETHAFGEGRHPGEFVFVPREVDSAEGDGWLVGLVLDSVADRSELVVLDTHAFEAEPVARVLLPHRIPPGFHGNWIARAAA